MVVEKIIIEEDSKIVVDAIKNGCQTMLIFGDYIRSCLDILATRRDFIIMFGRRDVNGMAHNLARISHFHGVLLIGMTLLLLL